MGGGNTRVEEDLYCISFGANLAISRMVEGVDFSKIANKASSMMSWVVGMCDKSNITAPG
jgi:hypothetical protein